MDDVNSGNLMTTPNTSTLAPLTQRTQLPASDINGVLCISSEMGKMS
jgi:hypothetical protein